MLLLNTSFVFRYHYNVADARLHQHIEKGNQDGLYISSVASSANFWALIMDAGTGFCSQVYELSQVFLNKVHYDLFLSLCPSLPLSPDSSLCMFAGVDYGTVGEELSHNSNSWSNQWKFLGCNVQRFVDYLFFTECYSN